MFDFLFNSLSRNDSCNPQFFHQPHTTLSARQLRVVSDAPHSLGHNIAASSTIVEEDAPEYEEATLAAIRAESSAIQRSVAHPNHYSIRIAYMPTRSVKEGQQKFRDIDASYTYLRTTGANAITNPGPIPKGKESGHLRVHVHPDGIQTWVLSNIPGSVDQAQWITGVEGASHPAMSTHQLQKDNKKKSASWVKRPTLSKYKNARQGQRAKTPSIATLKGKATGSIQRRATRAAQSVTVRFDDK